MTPAENLIVAERFRLIRLLGRGGMGSVWLAHHLTLDIQCAVKFVEGPDGASPDVQARFGREAKAAAAIRSPNVVQILDHGIFDGTPYMAMELLDGEDLGRRIARLGRLSPGDVCSLVAQVGRALTRAHGAGVIHRDLKPENIIVVRDEDREIAKVLDFGIAKRSGQAIEGSQTKTGALLGTPQYMSPEQAQGVKALDSRTDLWSLAVITFEALTGRLPFDSEALGDLLVKIIVAPLPVPSQVAPGLLPPGFDAWWARAAARDPAQRFQSARELSDALAAAFGMSRSTDSVDFSERSMTTSGTGFKPAGVRVALGSGPVLGATPSNPTLMADEVTSPPMARTFDGSTSLPGKRSPLPLFLGVALAVVVLGGGAALVVARRGAGAQPTAPMTAPPPAPLPSAPPSPAPAPSAAAADPAPAPPAAPSTSTAAATSASPPPGPPHPAAAPTYRRPPARKKNDDLGI